MIEVVVPVRHDHDQRWAVGFLEQLNRREAIHVHVLSVQPRYSGQVRMFLSPAWVHQVQREDAEQEMGPMCQALDSLGIDYERHVVEGSSAEEIARFARVHHCTQVVMGPLAPGHLSERIFGSLNRQVEHLLQQAGERCEVH